jgi:hypothetical protein
MLTAQDRTVPDCLDRVGELAGLGVRRIGFKDVGIDAEIAERLARAIHAIGAEVWIEMVALDADRNRAIALLARAIGADALCGGLGPEVLRDALAGSAIRYLPFAGKPEGHPTRLRGDAHEIAASARAADDAGCAGVDLLAFRAVDADPLDLIRAARGATTGELVVAGSVDTPARIAEVADAGADAFTIGSALFERRFAPGGDFPAQVRAVQAACSLSPTP